MKGLLVVLLIFVIASPSLCARVRLEGSPNFTVDSYGATGDGQTDDSQAFVKAWQDVCGASQDTATLLIPKKNYMLQPVSFQGPCKPSTVNIELQGTIIAPKSAKDWQWRNGSKRSWVLFSSINGLVINGGGQVDGQGAAWWNHHDSNNNRPTALRFQSCNNLRLSSLTHINSPRNHISITKCTASEISNLQITAPNDSPNTDGIDIAGSSNILIRDSVIKTGDDCIAINTDTSFVNISGILCGPGHGISVGSLGQNGEYAKVEEINVRNCTFDGTTNGARIKTWKGGAGYARKITFEDIVVVGAKSPLVINQQYSDLDKSGGQAVKISDVTFRNVRGTASTEEAVVLNCDRTVGCTNIVLENISITTPGGSKATVTCTNIQGTCTSCDPIVPCLPNH
ncbi:polygalacturonase protein [Spatholobus suberectus]|nr:polygalacturonase protein [Spatholobus suberectus]